MIKPIVIKVTDKVPELVSGPEYVVCNNSDYTVAWQLDEEWAQLEHRTMQVNYKNGTYERVLFTGDTCALPAIPVPGPVHVGLFAGDIHTTRPARLLAVRSATTDSGEERDPMPNGYAQAIQALDAKLDKNQGAENAGKALVIGDDGNVVPGEVQGSSYTLPVASPEQLGGVKPTAKTDEMTQQVGVDEDGALYTKPGKASDPVQSDWQQNDETAADYVKNRMGGYFQSVLLDITYDGKQDGKTVIDVGYGHQLVKVADVTGLKEDYVNSGALWTASGLTQYSSAESSDVYIDFNAAIIVFEPTTIHEIEFDEPGVYFPQMGKNFVERLVVGKNIVRIGSGLLDLSDIQREVTNTSNVADAAKTTADAAKTTADAAKTTAETAKTTADAAKTTAETAKTTADAAKTTADAAKTTADAAVRGIKQEGGMWYSLVGRQDQTDRVVALLGYTGGNGLKIKVTKASASVPPTLTFSPPVFLSHQADFAFTRSAPTYPHPKITEIGGIVMYASDDASKKFLITVNSSGTLSAVEVTNAS